MKLVAKRPSFTPRQRQQTLVAQGFACYKCGCDLGSKFHVDHRVSLALDGAHEAANWEALCIPCHTAKSRVEARVHARVRRLIRKADRNLRRAGKRIIRSRGFRKDLRKKLWKSAGPKIKSRGFPKRPLAQPLSTQEQG